MELGSGCDVLWRGEKWAAPDLKACREGPEYLTVGYFLVLVRNRWVLGPPGLVSCTNNPPILLHSISRH